MSHRIAQLSDTHFLADGEAAEGGFAYDTGAAFDAIVDHLGTATFDLVAVTGDVADHGRADQYRVAAAAFERLGSPVNVCPGNHDQHAVFPTVGRAVVATSRVVRIGNWCHLFVDSSAGVLEPTPAGGLADPPVYEDRLHTNGALGARESAWIREQVALTDAEHVFVWLHHPPAPVAPLCADDEYEAEWRSLIGDLPKVRGMAAGHTHVPGEYDFDGVPVFMAPSLKNNFDLEARTLLPPGYRTFEFADDGTLSSELHLVDDDQWPRYPYGRAVHSLMTAQITWDEFHAIVARKTAS